MVRSRHDVLSLSCAVIHMCAYHEVVQSKGLASDIAVLVLLLADTSP